MLCKHLGFDVDGNNELMSFDIASGQKIATGDVMCYTTCSNETSCCMHLQPSTTTSSTSIPNLYCKYTYSVMHALLLINKTSYVSLWYTYRVLSK